MRVLVTGGFGYLGGRLAQFLASQPGYEIVLGSRGANEPPSWLPHAKGVQTLWNSPSALEQICTGIDAVVHLAGMNAQDCVADPVGALEANAVATARILQAAIQKSVDRFIYMSTAHVYASPLVGAISETTCPVSLHPYATSHRAGEDVVRAAHERGDIQGIVVRLSNAFGAPAHVDANCWMLLVNDLCRQAVQNRQVVLRSSGLQARDFITLHDVSRALRHLLELPESASGDGLFNLGSGTSLTVWEMTQRIARCCCETLGFNPGMLRPEESLNEKTTLFQYDINKLAKTGFALTGDMDAEINQALRFCDAIQRAKEISSSKMATEQAINVNPIRDST